MGRQLRGAALMAVVLLAGCDWLKARLRTCHQLRVDLVNSEQTLAAVNVTVEDEGPSPGNLLASGASRRVSLCVEKGDREKFVAWRDGQILAEIRCPVSLSPDQVDASVARVVFGPPGFSCEGW